MLAAITVFCADSLRLKLPEKNKGGAVRWPVTAVCAVFTVLTGLNLIAQGKPVICMTMIDLLERIKRTYSATGGSESDVLKIYKTVPLLVIDDIGKEPPTEWAISTVYNIINGRYEAYLPTIVTTNYDTEALIDRMTPRESRDSMTARATIDRLMEMCRGITLTGQSWRSR